MKDIYDTAREGGTERSRRIQEKIEKEDVYIVMGLYISKYGKQRFVDKQPDIGLVKASFVSRNYLRRTWFMLPSISISC